MISNLKIVHTSYEFAGKSINQVPNIEDLENRNLWELIKKVDKKIIKMFRMRKRKITQKR